MSMAEIPLLGFSFLTSLLLLPLFRYGAVHLSLTSKMGLRRVSVDPVPVVGGAALVMTVPITCWLFGLSIPPLFLFSLPVFALGLLDDTLELTAAFKFPIEILMASLFVFNLPYESLVFSSLPFPELAIQIFTVFWIVGFTNSVNISDGIDGLAGSICLFGFAALGLFATTLMPGLNLILVGAIFAFLPFNYSKKWKIFLGDNGSLFLGFLLSGSLATSRWSGDPALDVLIALFLVSYPQVDTVLSILRRLINKKKVTEGDRRHIHHLLVDCGFPHWQATSIIVSFLSLAGFSLIAATQDSPRWAHPLFTLVAGFMALLVVLASLHSRKKRESVWIKLLIEKNLPPGLLSVVSPKEQMRSYALVMNLADLHEAFSWLPPHRLFDIVSKLTAIGVGPGEISSTVYNYDNHFVVLTSEQEIPALRARLKKILSSREFKLEDSQFQIVPASEIYQWIPSTGIAEQPAKAS